MGERMDRYEEGYAVIRSLLREDRTTFAGVHHQLVDAPCRPTPPAGRVPILIGAKGERRGLRVASRYADEWNSWATLDQLRHRSEVLARHCEAVDRDPTTIARSTQALVTFLDDGTSLDRARLEASDRPRLIGSPAQIIDQVGAYAEAGLDELIVPDWTFGDEVTSRVEALDRFRTEVAAVVR